MDKNKNNDKRNNSKKKDAEDILGMIRKRQEHNPSTDNSKLREFLNNIDEYTCEQDYSDTPIYKLGHEDGYSDGYDKGYGDAYYELFSVLKAIETVIQPHIEREC
jgi:hypothetical protein